MGALLGDAAVVDHKMRSALRIVDSRWAMTIDVRPTSSLFSASCTSFSLSVSRAEVASSRIRMSGFFSTARAIERRWRCPPESFEPRSPMLVS